MSDFEDALQKIMGPLVVEKARLEVEEAKARAMKAWLECEQLASMVDPRLRASVRARFAKAPLGEGVDVRGEGSE